MFPSEPVDTMDQRYLNYEFAPIVSPLKKTMGINEFDEISFNPKPTSTSYNPLPIDKTAFIEHPIPNIPTIDELNTTEPTPITLPVEHNTDLPLQLKPSTSDIDQSTDKLFFVTYTPPHPL